MAVQRALDMMEILVANAQVSLHAKHTYGFTVCTQYPNSLPKERMYTLSMLVVRKDAFGAGGRVGTAYAYLGGKICAWMQNPNPQSGTIVGMYLIDIHPKGKQQLALSTYLAHHPVTVLSNQIRPRSAGF